MAIKTVVIGKKASQYMKRRPKFNVVSEYRHLDGGGGGIGRGRNLAGVAGLRQIWEGPEFGRTWVGEVAQARLGHAT